MLKYFSIFMLFVLAAFSFHATALAEGPVGKAVFVEGKVQLQQKDRDKAEILIQGAQIYLGDEILTDEGGYAQIEFIDKTTITLNGKDGALRIDEYVFDPEDASNNRARFNIARASFIYVSGLLGKAEEPDVEIDLDFGTIGIRGTRFLRSMKDGECWILLEEGKIRVGNDAGFVYLKPDQGTRMSSTDQSPTSPKPWSAKNIAWIKAEVALPEAAPEPIDEVVGDVEIIEEEMPSALVEDAVMPAAVEEEDHSVEEASGEMPVEIESPKPSIIPELSIEMPTPPVEENPETGL